MAHVIYKNVECLVIAQMGNYMTLQNIKTGTYYLSINIKDTHEKEKEL